MTAAAIIQARMGSTRLPGKSMLSLAGKPVVRHVVDRARAAKTLDQVAVATSTAKADDMLAAYLADTAGVPVFRGSETDVLDRYARAAERLGADTVVRLTADDPLKAPELIDAVVRLFEDDGVAYACNNNPPTFPEGLDVEAIGTAALLAAAAEAVDPFDREHVTPFLRTRPDRFLQSNLAWETDLSHHRWTLDTEDDRRFFEAVFAVIGSEEIPPWQEVLALVEQRPDIRRLNVHATRSAHYS